MVSAGSFPDVQVGDGYPHQIRGKRGCFRCVDVYTIYIKHAMPRIFVRTFLCIFQRLERPFLRGGVRPCLPNAGTAPAGRPGQEGSSYWAGAPDGMKPRSMGGGLTSTSSPDGINMGTICASRTTILAVSFLIFLISSGTRNGSAI